LNDVAQGNWKNLSILLLTTFLIYSIIKNA
jgi:hypothetical protein